MKLKFRAAWLIFLVKTIFSMN